MKRPQFTVRPNVTLKNRLTNETITGNIVDERDIDGKSYWVLTLPSRGASRLSYAKESWQVTKGK